MRILIVNNNVMFEDEKGIYIYRANALFLVELSRYAERLEFFQFRMRFAGHDCMADFNIRNRGFEIFSIKRGKRKLLPYIRALWHGFWRIHHCDFLYLFYPGNICIILALFAFLQEKPFGLYVRGERGIGSRISRFLFRKAIISLTISPKFTGFIRGSGGASETIRPMMEDSEDDIIPDRVYPAKNHYKLLYVGRIELAKGSFDLVSALKILTDEGVRNISLDMAGDGPDAPRVRKQVEDLGLSLHIRFFGTISDRQELRRLYREADLFILPTHHEGFPRVLYESMIAGLPILTTFVGTIPFLMKDGWNCHRIREKDPAGIARTIAEVIRDYPVKAAVAINGTKTIRDYLEARKESHAVQLIRILREKGVAKEKK